MTNTEAAEEIQKAIDLIRQDGKDWLDERDIPILEMAINALKKEAWKEEHPVSPLLQKLATNLQPSKQDDLISRAAAQTELMMKCERYTLARESHGMGHVEWSDELIDLSDAMDAIRDLPSAQPETHEKRTETHSCDCISRQEAIDYCYQLINVEYEQGSDEMNYGHERVNQTETILHHLEIMPSAKPEIIRCRECKYWNDEFAKDKSTCWLPCMSITTHREWHCGSAERKTDGN